jgi:SAM-dependent methyltransferase
VTTTPNPLFPAGAFARLDEADDAEFYAPARLVTHIDENAIAAITAFYRSVLKPNSVVFDLMSSWVSHLPPEVPLAEVVGHGMNAEELAANPRLTRRFVQNLNRDSTLPLGDNSCDAVLCCVSVQYLQKPVEVFSEVRRVLRPAAPFIVSFSNRCFPTKAIAIWRALDVTGHATLLRVYFERAGFFSVKMQVLADGSSGDPLVAVIGRA